MLIEPDTNPVTLKAPWDPFFALWLSNREQNRFGTLPTFPHGGQLRTLIHHLSGKAEGLERTQTEAIFLWHISLAVRDK
jgi:hypothetical protein